MKYCKKRLENLSSIKETNNTKDNKNKLPFKEYFINNLTLKKTSKIHQDFNRGNPKDIAIMISLCSDKNILTPTFNLSGFLRLLNINTPQKIEAYFESTKPYKLNRRSKDYEIKIIKNKLQL